MMYRFSAEACARGLGDKVFEKLLAKPLMLLLYGEAASGKTNLALAIVKTFSACESKVLYISTEGSSYADRVAELGIDVESAYFAEALSSEHLLDLVARLFTEGPPLHLLVVDSVNRFYRIEAGSFDGLRLFLSTLALLRNLVALYGVRAVVTAQVHELEDVEPSGFKYMLPWVDAVAKLRTVEASIKEVLLEKPWRYRRRFMVVENGILWL